MGETRRTLVDVVVDQVLEYILSGQIKADDALPPEADIAKESGVSRLTAREAMKALKAQNVVYVKRGLGTFVNPPERWTGLDAIMRAAHCCSASAGLCKPPSTRTGLRYHSSPNLDTMTSTLTPEEGALPPPPHV